MRPFVAALLCCASLFTLACASSKYITPEGSVLNQADLDFAKATAEQKLEGWVSYFDENGSQLNAKGEWITGHDAIRRNMKATFDDPNFSLVWQPVTAAVSKGGRIGYTWGRYKLETKTKDGKPVVREGDYVTIWKKQTDGSWKVLFDTGDTD